MFNFFSTNPCGVKISDEAIEVMELSEDAVVETYGRKLLEEGLVENGEILETEKVAELLTNLLDEIGVSTERVVLSLPASQVKIERLEFKEESEKEKIDELIRGFVKINKESALYMTAEEEVIENYQQVIEKAGLELEKIEPEQLALGRALLQSEEKHQAIINFGSTLTTLGIFNEQGKLSLLKSFDFNGKVLNQAIADEEEISLEEAKHLKQQFGLNRTKRKNRVAPVIKEELESLLQEIKDEINSYEIEFDKVEKVLLSGRESLLPGLTDHIAGELGKTVQIGNPLVNLKDPTYLGNEDRINPVVFAPTIGLSLPSEEEVNLLSFEELSKKKKKQEPEEIEEKEIVVEEDKQELEGSKIAKGVGISLLIIALGITGYLFIPNFFDQEAQVDENENKQAQQEEQQEQEKEDENQVEEEPQEEQEEPEPQIKTMVTIQETGLGWLRVRKGPGTDYEEMDKVNVGKSFPFVSKEGNWYEIELSYGNGWVYGDYAEVSTTTVSE